MGAWGRYEGSIGGQELPNDSPGVLGFDDSIESFCYTRGKIARPTHRDFDSHIRACMQANLNILNLIAGTVPYNVCRNLEWQVWHCMKIQCECRQLGWHAAWPNIPQC